MLIYLIFYRFDFYYSPFFAPIFIVLSIILLTNKFRLTFASYKFINCLIDELITSGFHLSELIRKILNMRDLSHYYKHKVYILDDLDRSSLREKDRWALLANLWNYNTTYIVPLGYSEDEKLEGKISLK